MRPACPYVETLTGFKWIARVPGLRYGYEEALGYCVAPWSVGDKDGITAALLACQMLATLKAEGRSVQEALRDLAVAHGLHSTRQWSVRTGDAEAFRAAMQRVRSRPPTALAGSPVSEVTDFADGVAGLPATDAVRWLLRRWHAGRRAAQRHRAEAEVLFRGDRRPGDR